MPTSLSISGHRHRSDKGPSSNSSMKEGRLKGDEVCFDMGIE